MKKILHSGQFLDYDGNTIKITFYQEKHLWVSRTNITAPYTGGEYDIEIWTDVDGTPLLRDGEGNDYKDWLRIGRVETYTTQDGYNATKYRLTVIGRDPDVLIGETKTGTLTFLIKNAEYPVGYEGEPLTKTITITRS
jgi:hypothetical protein